MDSTASGSGKAPHRETASGSGQPGQEQEAAERKKERIRVLLAELKELQASPRSDWHAGFEALLRIEMHRYGQRVKIEREHLLGEAPPRADYLILKEEDGLRMDKEIYRIFRRHNIIEYKNPHDSLNERVLRKICGYANFYIGTAGHEGEIPADSVTVSVFRAVKNAALFAGMQACGMLETDRTAGIYHVKGLTDLPFQIVITGELEGPEYAAYRALAEHARKADVGLVIAEGGKEAGYAVKEHYRVLLDFIAKKNPHVVEKIRREHSMASVWMEIFKDEINEKISEGRREQEQETRQETMASAIRNIMESFGVGMEKAMDTLKIPPEQRSVYASLVRRM